MNEINQTQHKKSNTKSLRKSYIIGFFLSLLLTFAAYIPVVMHEDSHHKMFSHEFLLIFVCTLAVIQLIVQLIFFLHLWQEENPRWNLIFFVFTISLVGLVVIGSIWIMTHLNYNMSPMQMDNFLMKDEGIHK